MNKLERVLLVDDDTVNNHITKLILEDYNPAIDIEIAFDGEEAQEVLTEENFSPQLILLDINMPVLDGWEFMDWLMRNGYQGQFKIIMLSKSRRLKDREKCQEFDDVLTMIEKPLSSKKIESILFHAEQAI